VEFGVGGLSNLLTGGKDVVKLVLGEEPEVRIRILLDLLDLELGRGRNDAIVVGAVVCLTCITRHGFLSDHLKPVLAPKITELERNSEASTFALKNHVVILNDLILS